MPFIIQKRTDVPDGVLQVLDLKPNQSQRNLVYEPPGQTRYLKSPLSGSASTSTTGGSAAVSSASVGLSAWFMANIGNGTAVEATGTITVAAVPDASDTITIGGVALTAVSGARTPGSDDFSVDGAPDDVAADIAAAINDAGNSFAAIVTAAADADVVTLTAAAAGTAGNTTTLATSDAVKIVLSGSTLTGGASEGALTGSQARQNAQDVLDLLGVGDTSVAATAPTLANINGALTTGSISSGQLIDLLDVLAGRSFSVSSGTSLQTANQFAAAPGVSGVTRRFHKTGSFILSVASGQLSKFKDSGWTYQGVGGTHGNAVVVVDDDGSLL